MQRRAIVLVQSLVFLKSLPPYSAFIICLFSYLFIYLFKKKTEF